MEGIGKGSGGVPAAGVSTGGAPQRMGSINSGVGESRTLSMGRETAVNPIVSQQTPTRDVMESSKIAGDTVLNIARESGIRGTFERLAGKQNVSVESTRVAVNGDTPVMEETEGNKANGSKEHINEETKTPTRQVAQKVRNNPEFQSIWGETYAQAREENPDVNLQEVDNKAMDTYYEKIAADPDVQTQIEQDPEYEAFRSQEYENAKREAEEKGEEFDEVVFNEKIHAKYLENKDIQEEQNAQKEEPIGDINERVSNLEEEIAALHQENAHLNEELNDTKQELAKKANLPENMDKMLEQLMMLLSKLNEEEDEKKKQSLLTVILGLITAFMVSLVGGVYEGAKEEVSK